MKYTYPCIAIMVASLVILTSCEQRDALAPPTILYGVSSCDECKMIISEERYATAVIVEMSDGRHEPRVFDDVGCMLEHNLQAGENFTKYYAHDYGTLKWFDASYAWYLQSDTLHTPMAFGIAVFKLHADAEEVQAIFPGDIMDFNTLRMQWKGSGQSSLHIENELRSDSDTNTINRNG